LVLEKSAALPSIFKPVTVRLTGSEFFSSIIIPLGYTLLVATEKGRAVAQ
jgi:hypothetical protein